MKRFWHTVMMGLAAALAVLQPMQVNHGTTMCCAECQMKKEDEIEVVQDEEDETEA